ncbi:hypothetical protein SGPA1_50317 [Streptomyces misionensis JCM 4497]
MGARGGRRWGRSRGRVVGALGSDQGIGASGRGGRGQWGWRGSGGAEGWSGVAIGGGGWGDGWEDGRGGGHPAAVARVVAGRGRRRGPRPAPGCEARLIPVEKKGCEPTPYDVLMFCMSEGASPKGPEPEDTPNARVAE